MIATIAARRDGVFVGLLLTFLGKASYLTALCTYNSSRYLPVTTAQLMRPGIGPLKCVLRSG